MSRVFLDGTGITAGTEECKCGRDCDFPCWQRVGWAPECRACGCPPLKTLEELCDKPGRFGCGACEGCERWLFERES